MASGSLAFACVSSIDALQVYLVAVLIVLKSVQTTTGALFEQELAQIWGRNEIVRFASH